MRTHLPLPRPTIKIFRCKQHDIIGANAHRRKRGHDHMEAQRRRRRWRHVLNHREQEQETASISGRHHRFIWHSRHSEQGESQRKNDEGQGPGGPDHDCDGTSHAAVGPTAQGLGSIIIGHILDRQRPASAARRAEMGPPHVHVHRALISSLVSLLKAMTPQPEALSILQQQEQWLAPGHTQSGGRSHHHSHEGLPDTSDRDLSFTSESTRRKPAKSCQSVSLRHGRQAYGRHGSPPVTTRGYSHSISTTARTWKFNPGSPTNCFQLPPRPPVSQFWFPSVLQLDRDTESI